MRPRVEKSARLTLPNSVDNTDFQKIDPRRYRFSKNVSSTVYWFKKHKTPRRAYKAIKLSVYSGVYCNKQIRKEWQKLKKYFMKKQALKSVKKIKPRNTAADFLTDEVRDLIRLFENPTPIITEEEFEAMMSMSEEEMRQRNLDISLPEAQQVLQPMTLDAPQERFDNSRPGIDREDILHNISEIWPELLEKLEPRRTSSAPPSIKVTDSAAEPRRRLSDAENISPMGPMQARLATNRPRNILQEIQLGEDNDQLPPFQLAGDKPLELPQPDEPQLPLLVAEEIMVPEPEIEIASLLPVQQELIQLPVDEAQVEQEIELPSAPQQEVIQEIDVPEVGVLQRRTRRQAQLVHINTQEVQEEAQLARGQEAHEGQEAQELRDGQEQSEPPSQRPRRGRGRARTNRRQRNQRRGSRDRSEPPARDEITQDFDNARIEMQEIITLMQEWLSLEPLIQENAQTESELQKQQIEPQDFEIPSQQPETQPRESLPPQIRTRMSTLPTSFSVELANLPMEPIGRMSLAADQPRDLPEVQFTINEPIPDDILPGVPTPAIPINIAVDLTEIENQPPQVLQPPQPSAPEIQAFEQSSERPSEVRARPYLSLPRQFLTASGTNFDDQSHQIGPQQPTILTPTLVGISQLNLQPASMNIPQQVRASIPRSIGSSTSIMSNMSELHPTRTEVDGKLKSVYLIYLKLLVIKETTKRSEIPLQELSEVKSRFECAKMFAGLLELRRQQLIEINSGPNGQIISIRI